MTDFPDPIDVGVGARIKIRRRLLSMSQDELARGLGITFQQVQKYEKGANRVSASMLVKIAALLQTTVAALVGEDDTVSQPTEFYLKLAEPGVIELVEAFSALPDGEARRALLRLALAMVDLPLPVEQAA
jgi:transcriptional regulator with XRE-family HTH domain